MSDLAMKLDNLQNAWVRLAEGVARLGNNDELLRDGVIQRFEFTFELTWKTLKAFFEAEGLQNIASPKAALREAYAARMIEDEALWLDMLRDRNLTSHMYKQDMAIQVCANIQDRYLGALHTLINEIKSKIEYNY